MGALRLILGDQLSLSLASLKDCDRDRDWVLMAEVKQEATYVKHHKKKIAFLFSAMRHFAQQLTAQGFQVKYVKYTDPDNAGSLTKQVEKALSEFSLDRIVVTFPGEYRVLQGMKRWQRLFDVEVEIREDDRFLSTPDDFARWAEGRKQLRMEYFYREMRRSNGILLEGQGPCGGKWNYDAANRQPLPDTLEVPPNAQFPPDDVTQEVIELVRSTFDEHFGSLEDFHFAVTREQALQVLHRFVDERLTQFGDYQDAMAEGKPWLFHSHISFYLNCGLLLPSEVIQLAEQAYLAGTAPLNSVEGFIRQVLGWREYVRGLYWLNMPGYDKENFFQAQGALPSFFWDAETDMNCLHQCITETRDNAYAHHIQRLMVLGNFLLLCGVHPDEVNEWYLIVYADAYEWVEMPNVTGMILFADGGKLASKPYAASGAYINKMSNYCQHCHYNVKEKLGPTACPFNYLYWDFLDRNRDKLGHNPRLAMPYRTLNNMDHEKRKGVQRDSEIFLSAVDEGKRV